MAALFSLNRKNKVLDADSKKRQNPLGEITAGDDRQKILDEHTKDDMVLKDDKCRIFFPQPADARPSKLFYNTETTEDAVERALFRSREEPTTFLVFIYGTKSTTEKNANYACIFGPEDRDIFQNNLRGFVLDDRDNPQTAERAELRAAIEAVCKSIQWIRFPHPPEHLIIAYSGVPFLLDVAQSTFNHEEFRKRDNLDLKKVLTQCVLLSEELGTKISFWQVKEDDNRAKAIYLKFLNSTLIDSTIEAFSRKDKW